jgi:hypothetical protein
MYQHGSKLKLCTEILGRIICEECFYLQYISLVEETSWTVWGDLTKRGLHARIAPNTAA